MLLLQDRAAMARALTLDLDARLIAVLRRRIDDLTHLIDDTEFLIVVPGDSERDIIREVGFSPMAEPIDGIRFGAPGFEPFWDYLIDHGGWFDLSVSFGSTFAYCLLIQDAVGVSPDLLDLCRRYAAA